MTALAESDRFFYFALLLVGLLFASRVWLAPLERRLKILLTVAVWVLVLLAAGANLLLDREMLSRSTFEVIFGVSVAGLVILRLWVGGQRKRFEGKKPSGDEENDLSD